MSTTYDSPRMPMHCEYSPRNSPHLNRLLGVEFWSRRAENVPQMGCFPLIVT